STAMVASHLVLSHLAAGRSRSIRRTLVGTDPHHAQAGDRDHWCRTAAASNPGLRASISSQTCHNLTAEVGPPYSANAFFHGLGRKLPMPGTSAQWASRVESHARRRPEIWLSKRSPWPAQL